MRRLKTGEAQNGGENGMNGTFGSLALARQLVTFNDTTREMT